MLLLMLSNGSLKFWSDWRIMMKVYLASKHTEKMTKNLMSRDVFVAANGRQWMVSEITCK